MKEEAVDFVQVKDLIFNAIPHDEIRPAAGGERVSGPSDQVERLVQVQPQCEAERQCGLFFRVIIRIAPDLRKMSPVDPGILINRCILQAFCVDEFEKGFLECVIQTPENIVERCPGREYCILEESAGRATVGLFSPVRCFFC